MKGATIQIDSSCDESEERPGGTEGEECFSKKENKVPPEKQRQGKQNPTTLQNEPAEFYSPLKGLIFFEIRKEIDSFRSFFFTH